MFSERITKNVQAFITRLLSDRQITKQLESSNYGNHFTHDWSCCHGNHNQRPF